MKLLIPSKRQKQNEEMGPIHLVLQLSICVYKTFYYLILIVYKYVFQRVAQLD
jgi:hypothetical protein